MNQRFQEIRSAMISELCEVGELIRKGDDLFEDMGGHILHESNLDPYISEYLNRLTLDERTETIHRLGGVSFTIIRGGNAYRLIHEVLMSTGIHVDGSIDENSWAEIEDLCGLTENDLKEIKESLQCPI